jgi:hypothetical protein
VEKMQLPLAILLDLLSIDNSFQEDNQSSKNTVAKIRRACVS